MPRQEDFKYKQSQTWNEGVKKINTGILALGKQLLRLDLGPHGADRRGGRTNEDDALLFASTSKVSILAQEAKP